MNFCKELIWILPFSVGGILLGMTGNTQDIIGGLLLFIAANIKWGLMMIEMQDDFLRSLENQSNMFQAIFSHSLQYINRSKTEEKVQE